MVARLWLSSLFLLAGLRCYGRRAGLPSLRPGKTVELSAAGIRLKPFRGLKSIPAPTPRSGTGKDGREYFRPGDLWVRDQHIAHFTGPHAHIAVCAMKWQLAIPSRGNRGVAAADFHRVVEQFPVKWEDASLKAWAQTKHGRIKETSKKVSGLYLKHPYRRFLFETPATQQQAFALKVEDARFVFVSFQFVPGYKQSTVDRAVARALKSMSFFEGKAADGPSHKFQEHRGTTRAKRSAKYEKTRARVIRSIGNLEDWWYVETDNYIIKSNMTARNKSLVKKIQEDIEIMRRSYEVFIPPVREIEDVSVVTVFNTRQEYLAYVPPNCNWTGGVWMPGRKELVVSPYNWRGRYRRMGLEETLSTTFHEAFHQFLYYALPGVHVPVWFNEGHAVLFESVKTNRFKKIIEVEEHPRYAKVVEDLIEDDKIGIRQLVQLDYRQFYAGDPGSNYAQAWALVYFLRKAGPAYAAKGRQYHLVCDRLLAKLKTEKDWKKANAAAFEGCNPDALQRDFIAFWSSSAKRSAARRVDLFTEKEMWERSKQDAAERLARRRREQNERLGYSKPQDKTMATIFSWHVDWQAFMAVGRLPECHT